jgi:ribosomal protein S30
MEILPLASQYIFSLMLFVVTNRKEFIANTETYEIKTKQQKDLHQPLANLKKYQNRIHYLGIKVYNDLPPHIKDISNDLKKSKVKLKQILHIHSFHSLQEYLNYRFSQGIKH